MDMESSIPSINNPYMKGSSEVIYTTDGVEHRYILANSEMDCMTDMVFTLQKIPTTKVSSLRGYKMEKV